MSRAVLATPIDPSSPTRLSISGGLEKFNLEVRGGGPGQDDAGDRQRPREDVGEGAAEEELRDLQGHRALPARHRHGVDDSRALDKYLFVNWPIRD